MNSNKKTAQVFHFDIYGRRREKFNFLLENNLQSIPWQELAIEDPNYFFVPKDFSLKEEYEKGFSVTELFTVYGSGIKFRKDNLLVKNNFTQQNVKIMLNDLNTLDDDSIRIKYDLSETPDWKLSDKKVFFKQHDFVNIRPVQYRPFDIRFTYYPLDGIEKIIVRGDSRKNVMQHFIKGENIGLVFSRQFGGHKHFICFVTDKIIEISSQPFAPYNVFPLYIYQDQFGKTEKVVNMNEAIVQNFSPLLWRGAGGEVKIFDYIYAVLHSPSYRERYKEFLKIDFPRVPYPKDAEQFEKLAALGERLRRLHLMEPPPAPSKGVGLETAFEGGEFANFPKAGSNKIEKPEYSANKVWINDSQYFDNVPEIAWNFYIGGYQPAQKWLKDRKGRSLTYEDIEHYRKIIFVLYETNAIMKEIDHEQQ